MYARNCTPEDLRTALYEVNKRYSRNICFNQHPEWRGKRIIFTLKVRDCRKSGHRRGFPHGDKIGRRMPYACWHVHGHFFEALFKNNRNAKITSDQSTITAVGEIGKIEILALKFNPFGFPRHVIVTIKQRCLDKNSEIIIDKHLKACIIMSNLISDWEMNHG